MLLKGGSNAIVEGYYRNGDKEGIVKEKGEEEGR
jgi:hypothetical protein